MPTYVDTHCHLDHHEDVSALDQVERAREAGVTTLVTVGTDLASSSEAVQTASRFDGVYAAVGVHPNDSLEATPAVMDCITRLARHPKVVAIGETGLDYYRDHAPWDRQREAFRLHIALAKEYDKALVVHCRDAWDDVLRILREDGAPPRTVLHCFSGDAELARRCGEFGWFISFAGNVTFKNAQPLRDAAAAAPHDALLVETDSPFLTPHPLRGTPNEPARVALTVACLADVIGVTTEEMAATTTSNARRAFGLG